ncbi:hypothetical protein [Flavisolibacter nicotianae]|uniref:hypothetical protein n=1 Tax=Flavisolibacter nicotianae TaxID=2364882 RepID=UPI000EAC6D1B|nr:hypothetical protein [Flavisolibacter nicotianae]
MNLESLSAATRVAQLKKVAEDYFESLRNAKFETIPCAETASIRTPFDPGGVLVPTSGKDVYEKWWLPLGPALKDITVNILGHYIQEDLSGIISEAEISLRAPAVTLRVADRFTVNEESRIIEQENHFDPRAVTG